MTLRNVYAVRLDNGARRLIAEGKTQDQADAIIMMAVMRRAVEEEFFMDEEQPDKRAPIPDEPQPSQGDR